MDSLNHELGLNKPIRFLEHEAMLNILFTATRIKKHAVGFLKPFGITEVQLNLMLMITHQAQPGGGLSQAKLSEMLLVNRANITSLVDRMQKSSLVIRTAAEGDRRYNIIKLTDKGKQLVEKAEPLYHKEFMRIMGENQQNNHETLINMLEKIRGNISR